MNQPNERLRLRTQFVVVQGLAGTLMLFALFQAKAQTSSTSAPAIAPAQAAAAEGAPSEAARRQALSPFRFILRHAETPNEPRAPASSAEVRRKPTAPAAIRETADSESKTPPDILATPPPESVTPPARTETAIGTTSAAPTATRARAPLIPIKQDGPVLTGPLQRDPPLGTVKVAFDVLTNGTTSDVKVVQSTNRRLNGPALAAVQAWRFQPIDEARSLEIDFVFSDQ